MWQHFKDFIAKPYSDDMDALNWFWFLGLLIVISALWAMVFRHIKDAV